MDARAFPGYNRGVLRPGDAIAERFEIVRAARAGGTSMVFEAIDRRTAKKVAIKVINVPREEGLAQRIEREVRILASLAHPHVVGYQGSGLLPDGKMFVALEWLSGRDLADHIAEHTFTLGAILDVGEQVAGALAAAHARGIVHRDVKPANVFLVEPAPGRPPDVRVIDFGVAKANEAGSSGGLTRAGAILGTPAYMAPEQANYAMDVDARADIFSLGVVLFELLTARLPWSSRSDLARLARILTERALPVRDARADVPLTVAQVVDAMLSLDPAGRPASMKDVTQALSRARRELSPAELARVYGRDLGAVQRMLRQETGIAPALESVDATTEHGVRVSGAPIVLPVVTEPLGLVPSRPPSLTSAQSPGTPPSRPPSRTSHRPREGAMEVRGSLAPLMVAPDPSVQARVGLPLVGRRVVLDRLIESIARAIAEDAPKSIAVVGPAGIGKTRLRVELVRVLRNLSRPPVVLSGRAEEPARSTPFGFLRRVLHADAGIFPDDPPDTKRAKLDRLIPPAADVARALRAVTVTGGQSEERTRLAEPQRVGWVERPSMVAAMTDAFDVDEAAPLPSDTPRTADEEERALVLGLLGDALDVPFPPTPALEAARRDPRAMAVELRRALDLALRERARAKGLVILVDDAHQLDRPSAEVLRGLAEHRGPPAAVVVVAFGLPTLTEEPPHGRAPWIPERVEVLTLGPLDAGASRQIARLVLAAPVRPDALEILIQRSGGNPLYLEQLVRAVKETEVLAPGPSGEHGLVGLVGDAEDVERVPPTVAAAVRARLGALVPELEATLAAAAVLGEVFWVEGIAAMLGHALDDVMFRLDRLTVADFVRRRAASRYQGTTELELSHAVMRSVLLSKVGRPRRRELEAAAVRFLETVGERDSAVMAGHLVQAGLKAPAARLYSAAAERSVAAGDFAAASTLADEGLALAEGGVVPIEVHARLLELSAQAAALAGDLDAAERAHETLEPLARPDEVVARAEEHRARVALEQHRYADAVRWADRAVERWRNLGRPACDAVLVAAEAVEATEDDRAALKAFVTAQALFEGEAERPRLARVEAGMARIALASGDYGTAENRFRATLVHSRAVHDARGLFEALLGLGVVARRAGDTERALRCFDGAERLATERAHAQILWAQRALAVAERGGLEEARAQLDALSTDAWLHTPGAGAIVPTLAWATLAVGFGPSWAPTRAQAEQGVERVARALEQARADAPALAVTLQGSLGLMRALAGDTERGRRESDAAVARFVRRGALREDEPWRFLVQHAAVLARAGAPPAERAAVLSKAIQHLDLVLSRLDRTARERALARPGAEGLLTAARAVGLDVVRDPRSHRVTAGAS